jgi:hypothetical protein
MLYTGHDISKCVAKGHIFLYKDNIIPTSNIYTQFIEIQQTHPPQDTQQLEAFGGTLNRMLVTIIEEPDIFTLPDFKFIIFLCMEHIDVDYLVVCVLQIILMYLRVYPRRVDAVTLLPYIYFFLIFLTEYYSTHKSPSIYWEYDVIILWVVLFTANIDMCTMFCENKNVVISFLDMLKCTNRNDVTISRLFMTPSNEVIVYNIKIHGCIEHKLCFHYIYGFLCCKEHVQFRSTIIHHWPFIVGTDGELRSIEDITEILQQRNHEENNAK